MDKFELQRMYQDYNQAVSIFSAILKEIDSSLKTIINNSKA